MKVEIRFRRLQRSEALKQYAVRRAHFALSRFNGEISSVGVTVGDVNGPKGGLDKRCQVTVRGPSIPPVRIESASADAYSSVDLAFERVGRLVGREIERTRLRSR